MHRVTNSEGVLGQSVFLRWVRTSAYVMFGVTGLLLLLSPVVSEYYGAVAPIYASFMVAGGFLAALGSFTHRWPGEFLGLPLLASSFAAFGLEVWGTSQPGSEYLDTANLLLLWALAALMLSRWRVVYAIHHLAREVALLPDAEDETEPEEGERDD